jgi:23S rRNA (pseudouridine1915-N3)-methyltransferase
MAKLIIVSVAAKLPGWSETACADYLGRLPRGFETRRVAIRPEPRSGGKPLDKLLGAEAKRIDAALPAGVRRIALDERGRDLGTQEFAKRLRQWLDSGQPSAFLIGGADGLDAALKQSADLTLRLSSLTLPHALAQLLLCEQLYRAATLLAGHPYHRD